TAPTAPGPSAPAESFAPAPVNPAPAPAERPAAPDWTASPALVGTVPPAAATMLPEDNVPPARQVELARAYLDLGDEPAARALLREAMEGRDPVAREIATRMLRELG
ncbi:MAG: FimV/HubP family polar landmark protein, partial [Luteimonas sp.]